MIFNIGMETIDFEMFGSELAGCCDAHALL